MMSDEGIKRDDFQAADVMPADIGTLMAENERRKSAKDAAGNVWSLNAAAGDGWCRKRC